MILYRRRNIDNFNNRVDELLEKTCCVIDFSKPVICKDDVLVISPTDLDDFYMSASDYDKSNLFFVLLTSVLV